MASLATDFVKDIQLVFPCPCGRDIIIYPGVKSQYKCEGCGLYFEVKVNIKASTVCDKCYQTTPSWEVEVPCEE